MTNRGGRRPHGHGPMAMPGQKAKNFKGSMKKSLQYMGRYRLLLLLVILFAVAGTLFSVVGPKILGNATTEIFRGMTAMLQGTGGIDFALISRIVLLLAIIYGISALFQFGQGFIMSGITQKLCYRMRKELSEKINRMPLGYFERQTHGEVLSRMTNDVDTFGQSLNQSVTQIITAASTMLGVLVMMLRISGRMTLIAILILPVSGLLVMQIVKRSQKYFRRQQEYLAEINGQVEEVFSGHTVVRTFNHEEASMESFREANDRLRRTSATAQFLSGIMMPMMNFVGNLGYVIVSVYGAVLALRGTILVGDIQAFIQYVKQFTQPVSQMAQMSNMLQSMAAAAERIFEFLEETEEEPGIQRMNTEAIRGEVSFEHVRFGYREDTPVIHDFTAHVTPGQKVAIVGPTGAGKTTMVKLLMRFYDVNEGRILVDGEDIRGFERSSLREAFGMVLQDTWLFGGTIRENIRYGRLEASDEEVEAAAKAAMAHDFIETLPGGYDMELSEDAGNISQGQRQLLTIARALLADNRILILDEATSSVDTRTEQLIQKAMDRLMQGRTSFIIAHRLSTIRNADVILVMKDGDICEQGSHEQLMEKGGFYCNLYNSQFESA